MSNTGGSVIASREPIPAIQLPTPDSSPSPTSPDNVAENEPTPKVVKLSQSKGANILNKYYIRTNGMFFQTSKDAKNAMGQAQWRPPINDATMPQSDEEERRIVRRLFDALCNTKSALDTKGSAYRKRFTPGTNVYYDLWPVEACAWGILVSSY